MITHDTDRMIGESTEADSSNSTKGETGSASTSSPTVTIPILGVTKEVEEYEGEVIGYLRSELQRAGSDIRLMDSSIYEITEESLDETVDKLGEFDGKVILLTDAAIGNTNEYESIAHRFYDDNIRPLVLVTHVESARFDLLEVSMRLTYLAEYFDRRAEWYHHLHQTVFFNFDTKGFLASLDGTEGGIDIFIDAIKKYIHTS